MSVESGGILRRSVPWLILGMIATVIVAFRLQLSFDLSAFFPREKNLIHEVLLDRFRNGPGSRLLIVGINGAPRGALEDLSDTLKTRLLAVPAFSNVLNGEPPDDPVSPPEPIESYYLLMRNVDYSQASLERAVQERLQDLAFGGGNAMLDLIARDPFLVTLDVLQNLSPVDVSGELWFAADGSAVLIAETRATAVDISGQADAVEAIRHAFSALAGTGDARIDITGVGAFGVELQKTIRAEAMKRSSIATISMLIILLVFYRKPRYLLLAALPIGMGFLTGLAVVSMVFDTVHGITLAFGFTLMGIAIDYPLHLYSHGRYAAGEDAMDRIWPTMRLGAVSTAVAYLALAMSGSDGLAQLGIFTASGILVALLVTRTWLPFLLASAPPDRRHSETSASASRLSFVPALVVLATASLAVLLLSDGGLWDDRLSSLSPVPEGRLLADRQLRSATGAPDLRYQIMLHDTDVQSLLRKTELADAGLAEAAAHGLLDDWQSVTQVLPSATMQRARQARLPDVKVLRNRVDKAIVATPFHGDAFEAFVNNVERTRSLLPLAVEDIERSTLSSWLDAHILKLNGQWVSLISLLHPDAGKLGNVVPQWAPDATLMDLRQASVELMRDYRNGALKTVSFATLIVMLLLWYQRRRIAEVAWIGLSVIASLSATVMLIAAVHGQLTVIHLIALLLVMGLGLDYALFLSRTESDHERRATRHAVTACAASTTLAFGILAGSSIPLLKFLGLTVACGAAISYLLAVAGSRVWK